MLVLPAEAKNGFDLLSLFSLNMNIPKSSFSISALTELV